ncbi:hypothetical protein BH09PAT1_BH09PAT1_1080 [soil metagenome]
MAKPQPYEKASSHMSFSRMASSNFIGGIFWALGVTIGLSLLIALMSLISHYINFIPIIGKFVSEIIDFVLSHNPRLH